MDLDYDPSLANLMVEVERHARRLGLALGTLELLGQHPKVARDFLRAARQGRARQYVDALDHDALERALARRELGMRKSTPVGVFFAL